MCKVRILCRIGIGILCKVRILCRIRIGLYRMGVVVLNLNFISDCNC